MNALGDIKPEADGSFRLPSGIYFDLPSEVYHADPALGSTSIKALAVDPYEFQFDRLYGEDIDTDAKIFGSALHARTLEGEDALHEKFCREFDKTLVEGALDTVADLKGWLEKHGQVGLSSMRKPELIQAVLNIDPDARIVEVIKGAHEKANEGKTPLKPKRWAQIEVAARWIQRDPLLAPVMENGTFKAGAPEVSIFYEDPAHSGVRLKCRFDRLLRHAIIDLKSFAPMFDGPIETAAIKAIHRFRYDLQAADYLRGWQRARDLHAAGLVFGREPHEGFLAECFDRPVPKWIWIMVKSKGAPQPLVIDWQAEFAMRTAADQVEDAIARYAKLKAEFGDEAEWPPMRPALTVCDTDLPNYFGQQ